MKAIPVWFESESIHALLPSGEVITFPAREPALFVAFLRRAAGHVESQRNVRLEFERAAVRKGAEIRAAEEARQARERERFLRKDRQRMAKKEAEALLAEIGL